MAGGEGGGKALAAQLPLAVIVAGPTCSGKSALAGALARRLGGVIINADAMQTYRELRVLTARPTVAEEAAWPHALYGVRAAADPGSAAWWRGAALLEMERAEGRGLVPILCGGTGLYFSALREGLAEIPDPGVAARAEARGLLEDIGAAALHARLAEADPESAARLQPSDGQRVARAWEVWRGTGRGLAAWQAGPAQPPAPWRFRAVRLEPPRPELRGAIEARFAAMLEDGAVEEVRALMELGLDPSLPLMRAHGVPELMAWLRGEITEPAAGARAIANTAAYTKRQATWFRHHDLSEEGCTRVINARIASSEQLSESEMADMQNFLLSSVDAVQHGP
jgi:tRNA dimethylallyltransferase